MTKALKKQKQREYSRAWYLKNKAKKDFPQTVESVQKAEDIPLITIINAYYVLHSATTDGQIRADLNKVLSSIIAKQ